VNALVVSSIRYCISIYGTCGTTQLHRVQKLLNFCARVISGRRKYDRISGVLKELKWLRAKQLVKYHQLCLLKSVLATGLPSDIAEMFSYVSTVYNTRKTKQLFALELIRVRGIGVLSTVVVCSMVFHQTLGTSESRHSSADSSSCCSLSRSSAYCLACSVVVFGGVLAFYECLIVGMCVPPLVPSLDALAF